MSVTRLEAEMPHEEFIGWAVHDSLEEEERKAREKEEKKSPPADPEPDEELA